MKPILGAIAATFVCTACSAVSPAPFEPGQTFTLHAGASAQGRDSSLQIGFDGVISDSRCPEGERCIRAGDATVRIWVQQGAAETRQTHVMQLNPGQAAPTIPVGTLHLHLLRLDPYPRMGRSIEKQDYVVTLSVLRRTSGASER